MRSKLRRATGWAMFAGWLLFGTSCVSHQEPKDVARILLDTVQAICPPEITVAECSQRIQMLLDLAFVPPRDAGTE